MARGSGPDLFAAAGEERVGGRGPPSGRLGPRPPHQGGGPQNPPAPGQAPRGPVAARLRPRSLDEVVGQQHLLGPGKSLRVLIENDRLSSLVLWGPPGTGKTTIARLVAGVSAKAFETLSAVSAGVKDVREVA